MIDSGLLATPFREAVAALDAGDVPELERLLATYPALVTDRTECGEGYFRNPYLLWFVAENPIRHGRLPGNIVDVTRSILKTLSGRAVASRQEQVDYALALVCSGRIPRESGAQAGLIDVLVEHGADPNAGLVPALAHRENTAAARVVERGATVTLLAAVCLDRLTDIERLVSRSSPDDRQLALAGAALHGRADAIRILIASGLDLDRHSPAGFHQHATALHHAVDSGSLAAVRLLVEAGARLDIRDLLFDGTALDWAEYMHRDEIAAYLRGKAGAGPAAGASST